MCKTICSAYTYSSHSKMKVIIALKRNCVCLVLLVLGGCLTASGQGDFISEERKLFKKLFGEAYHPSVRPVRNESEAVEVTFQASIQEIRGLDPQRGILYTHMWLHFAWKDPRLTWNESEFGGVESIRVDKESIWTPDILPYNGQVTYISPQDTVVISSSGHTSWFPPVDLATSCTVDLTKFPYDKQTCTIKFGSWTYDGSKLNLTLIWNEVDIASFQNNLYDVVNHTVTRNVVTFECCPEHYIDITLKLIMKRVSGYTTHMLVAPPLTLALLLPVLFLLPPENSEKMQLGAGLLITHAVLLSVFSSVVPIEHYTLPLLGVYHVINIILVCFSIACAGVVRNLWAKSNRNVRMPNCIRTMFLGIFGRLLCVSQYEFLTGEDSSDPKDGQATSDKDQDRILESSHRAIASAQWCQLAVILDRLCLVIYILITIITVIRFAAY